MEVISRLRSQNRKILEHATLKIQLNLKFKENNSRQQNGTSGNRRNNKSFEMCMISAVIFIFFTTSHPSRRRDLNSPNKFFF